MMMLVLAVVLGLMMAMLGGLWQDEPAPQVLPLPPRPAPLPVTPPQRVAAPLPKPVEKSRPAVRCENMPVTGSHTSRAEWEARKGALEDVADVCPAGKVVPTQVRCIVVDGEQGIMGYSAIKCVQQAICTLCGDDLARQLSMGG